MAVEPAVIARIEAEARASSEEICGALIGRADAVSSVIPLKNQSADRTHRFFIPATEVLRIENAAKEQGEQLLGFYHSHPGCSATPSAYDLDQALPGFIYVIAPREGKARAWKLRADRSGFRELRLPA